MEDINYCPNCGFEIKEEDNYCGKCGQKIKKKNKKENKKKTNNQKKTEDFLPTKCPECGSIDVSEKKELLNVTKYGIILVIVVIFISIIPIVSILFFGSVILYNIFLHTTKKKWLNCNNCGNTFYFNEINEIEQKGENFQEKITQAEMGNNENNKSQEESNSLKEYFADKSGQEYWILECSKCGKILCKKKAEYRRKIGVKEANRIIILAVMEHNASNDCNIFPNYWRKRK